MAATSIYERYGGFATVRRIVSSFYDRVLDDPVVAHHFEHVDMRRLVDHQVKFVTYLMGGPASYSDNHLQRVHERLAITKREFDGLTALFRETLEDFELDDPDVDAVYRELRDREHLVVAG